MNKFFTLLFLGTLSVTANAQTVPSTQPFGKIDKADLEMKACDFEKMLMQKCFLTKAPFIMELT
ncbi:MAG: hypothetical protein JWP78_1871 [Mucilaginibacter sp.]|nr:hypothetical protein [Mucilaginibacter sp.]